MNKKVLLVGSSFSAAPFFFRLQKRNLDIFICGGIRSDPCHQYTQNSYYLDYSNKEDLLNLVTSEKFDYVVPSCNDYSYLSCAWTAEHFDLPGYDSYETTLILHSKDAFRSFTEKHGFPVPKAQQVKNLEDVKNISLNFPILLKPVDSFSGRGISKLLDDSDLENAIKKAISTSRSEKAVIEEFVNGSLHSHSVFIRNGQIIFETFADEYCTVYPYQVNCSNIPTILSEKIRLSVRECLSSLIKILNLTDGLLHTQFIVNGQEFWLIECMRRAPGDLYGKMVEHSTGVDYTDLYVRPFLDEKLPANITIPQTKFSARHTISVAKQQIFTSLTHHIPSCHTQFVPLKQSGEILEPAPFDKLGIIFADFKDKSMLAEHTPHLAETIKIE